MGPYSSWRARQTGNPLMLLIAGMCLTVTGWIGYKSYYKPWARRRSLQQAEEYAKVLMND